MCCSNDCLEKVCCSLEVKAQFFSIWTIVHGVIFLGASIYFFVGAINCPLYGPILLLIGAIVHLAGGLCLLFGYGTDMRYLFLAGIILSSIMPYILLPSIYLPVIQIIFTITSCIYYKKEMPK
ncbi:uncharacterized protein LOC115762329 [Drosophila novamexicana]|uniref:uncharacterized protein LOC115762329 n=1 Tax=Drosophila novamexicana TaxID=47314 RepID=UPI0011E5FFF7|nr:uncharacterized protein LOC115762329 [Drosophila novamexicana]